MAGAPDTQEAKSFFTGLFDFSFSSFITMKFLRLIYIVVVVVILLGGAFFLISSLSRGGLGVVFGLVVVPLVTLLYLVLARIYLELVALLFRIGDNTAAIATALQAGGTSTSGAPSYGPLSAGPDDGPPRVR